MLIDAGANTASAVALRRNAPGEIVKDTAFAIVNHALHKKEVYGNEVKEKQPHSLRASRRVLLGVDAVHEVS